MPRYKLPSYSNAFTATNGRLDADAQGFFTPRTPAEEAALVAAGAVPEGGTFKPRSPLPRVGVMGDSIALQNTELTSLSYLGKGWLNWANARLGVPWYLPMVNNWAVGGLTTDQINATQLPQVLASHASKPMQRVFISAGINDDTFGLSIDQRKNAFSTLFGTLTDAGITPVHIGVLPRGNDGTITTAKRRNMHMNEWLEWYSITRGNIEYVDCAQSVADTTTASGNILTALSDGAFLHPNMAGAFHMGKTLADYYSAKGIGQTFRVATQRGDSFDATNNPTGVVADTPNPFLVGGGAGTAPTGMVIVPATAAWQWGGTRTLPNGQTKPIGIVTLGPTANHSISVSNNATGAFDTESLRTGDFVYAQAEIILTSVVGLSTLTLQVDEFDGSTTVNARVFGQAGGDALGIPDIPGPLTLYLRSAPVPIRAWSGVGNSNVNCRIFASTTAAGAGTIQVNSFEVRKWVGEI